MKLLDKKTLGDLVRLLIFVIVTTLATGILVLLIGNISFGATNTYKAEFSDVTGVNKGDDVRVAGVKVGSVKKIEVSGRSRAMNSTPPASSVCTRLSAPFIPAPGSTRQATGSMTPRGPQEAKGRRDPAIMRVAKLNGGRSGRRPSSSEADRLLAAAVPHPRGGGGGPCGPPDQVRGWWRGRDRYLALALRRRQRGVQGRTRPDARGSPSGRPLHRLRRSPSPAAQGRIAIATDV